MSKNQHFERKNDIAKVGNKKNPICKWEKKTPPYLVDGKKNPQWSMGKKTLFTQSK